MHAFMEENKHPNYHFAERTPKACRHVELTVTRFPKSCRKLKRLLAAAYCNITTKTEENDLVWEISKGIFSRNGNSVALCERHCVFVVPANIFVALDFSCT